MQIRLDHVSKRFDATTAVDEVSLTVRAGEFVTVAGPPGCGKSTLLRLIAGTEVPSSGTVQGESDVATPARFLSAAEGTAAIGGDELAGFPAG